MAKIIESDKQFEEIVYQRTDDKVVRRSLVHKYQIFVDFFATWCGSCKLIDPAFQEFSGEFKNAEFYKADVEEMEWIAEKEKVATLPFFVAFQNGKQLGYYPGTLKDKLKDFLSKHSK